MDGAKVDVRRIGMVSCCVGMQLIRTDTTDGELKSGLGGRGG
jgi:hypothetical protein